MEQSILKSTKKVLAVDDSYDEFDMDIITFINSAFSGLTQLGVGPIEGFVIEDDSETWDSFVSDLIKQSMVKTFVFLKVRMLFDPPQTSFLINAVNEQIREIEQRISYQREDETWVPTLLAL